MVLLLLISVERHVQYFFILVFAVLFLLRQLLVCNVGSACLEDLREANGSKVDMWPEIGPTMRINRIGSEKNRLKLNKYQPAVVPKYTEVTRSVFHVHRALIAAKPGRSERTAPHCLRLCCECLASIVALREVCFQMESCALLFVG